jgi:hypothetical protein
MLVIVLENAPFCLRGYHIAFELVFPARAGMNR